MTIVKVGISTQIINSRGQLLVGERLSSHGANKFATPGGHLEFGETWGECAARELMEETGIIVSPDDFEFVTATNDIHEGIDSGKHYVTIFMRAFVKDDLVPQNLEPHKCSGWIWKTQSELMCNPDNLFLGLSNYFKVMPDITASLVKH